MGIIVDKGEKLVNNEMAYLLGMITGNGEVQRGLTETTICIDIPHKKLETEFQKDVGIYVKASMIDIRSILEPLLGTGLTFTQNRKVSLISFRKSNEDYLMREIMRYIGNATSSDNVRISPEVFTFTTDERKQFIKGFADVTGYIRRSNYAFAEPNYRVYFEIPQNWELVVDFSNLLKSIDIPVQNIDWAHPNMRDGNLKKYNAGNHDFWKKEHQIKVWAVEYQPVGFAIIHKQEALDYFADKQRYFIEVKKHRNVSSITHKYYWESARRYNQTKPIHPAENDDSLPKKIRGKHFDSWTDIAKVMGYKEGKD